MTENEESASADHAQGARVECAQCTKEFRANRPWQKFCSKKCRADYHVAEVTALRREVMSADPPPQAKCERCETTFPKSKDWRRFCSDKCRAAQYTEDMRKRREALRSKKKKGKK